MKNETRVKAVCPLCGKSYCGVAALSRDDNKTQICPDCGTRQALQVMGVDTGEQEQILKTIHECSRSNR